MKIVDMSHVMNVHTPGWVGYAGNRMYYAQNLQTQMIVAQRIETALHVGTHFDGAMHATDDPKGDTGSRDHAMNTSIRSMRSDLAAQFTKQHGKPPGEFFGTFEYVHKKSGRRVAADVFPFHSWAFQEGLLHAENLGGDIELMLNKRALIGAFPWRYQGLEACP